jgi:TolB protein
MNLTPVFIKHIHFTLGLAAVAMMAVSCMAPQPKPSDVVFVSTGAARDITRLTQSPQDKSNPSVSPDGKTVAFQVFKDNLSSIWTVDGAGRNLIQVTSLPSNEIHPSWLPDSHTIVFASDRLGAFALWRRLASGAGGATMITKGGDMIDSAPSASPQGKKIAFTSQTKTTLQSTIVVNGVKQFTVLEKNLPYIWTVNLDGTDLTQLVQGAYPVWSPDGTIIAYSSDVSGSWEIWTMSADGSASTQLTTTTGKNQFAPSYSPDGKWIAYTSNVSGNYDLWIMKADGSAQTQLTSDKHEASSPCWGSDGNIYFSSNKSGNWEIWRLTPVLPD